MESDIKNSTKKKILEVNSESIQYSSFHGLVNVLKNPYKEVKIFWSICILASVSYCCYNIFVCFANYFDYSVTTRIDVTYENQMPFPIVKLCRSDLNIQSLIGYSASDVLTFNKERLFYENYLKSKHDITKRSVGITNLSEILINCVYNLVNCNLTEDFNYFYDSSFGSCWQYNAGKSFANDGKPMRFSAQTGPLNGLKLEIYMDPAESNYAMYSNVNSMDILITNESSDSSILNGVKVSPGYSTHIILNKYAITSQPSPYSNCISGLTSSDDYPSLFYKKTLEAALNKSRNYHYSDCLFMCLQKSIGDKCGCQDSMYSSFYSEMPACLTENTKPCFFEMLTNFYSKTINSKSSCDCPLECSKNEYALTTSYTNYPTKFYADVLAKSNYLIQEKFRNQTLTQSLISRHALAVSIYYDEMKLTSISYDIKITTVDLISQIGGQLGLFTGISLLTFIEILEFLLQSFLVYLEHRKSLNF